MNATRRRAIGLLTVLVAVAALSMYTVARIKRVSRDGWAGFSYIPAESKRSKGTVRVGTSTGPRVAMFTPGSIVFLYPGAPAERGGFGWGDRVLSVNGIPTSDFQRLNELSRQTRSGDVITYRLARNGVEREVRLRFESPVASTSFLVVFTTTIAVAVTFLLIGSFVFWRRPTDTRAVVFIIMTVTATMSFINGSLAQIDIANARGITVEQSFGQLTRVLPVIALGCFFAPLLLHLALIFPKERPLFTQQKRALLTWIYGFPIYGMVIFGALIGFGAALQTASGPAQKQLFKVLGFTLLGIIAVAAVVAIIKIVRRAREVGTKQALIRSPIATMTLIPPVFTAFLVIAAVMTKKMHSPVPIIIFGLICFVTYFAVFTAYPIATVISLFRSYRDSGVEERRQVKWPVWGTIVAVGGKLIALLIGLTVGLAMSTGQIGRLHIPPTFMTVPDIASRVVYVLIPLSFAFAILKYRLMNIDVIVRKTVLYSILTAVVFILYAVLVAGLGTALVKFAGMTSQTMLIASTVVIALVTVPIRNRLQRVVDRNLFRERRDYPLALRNISTAIGTSGGIGEFLRICAEQIQQAVQSQFAVIALRQDQEYVATAKVGVSDEVIGALRVPAGSLEFSGPIPEPLRRVGARLILPVRTQREPVAMLALGSKLSDEDFSAEDVEFLTSAASQVALGLENLRLRDEESEYEQARVMQQILLPTRFPQLEGFTISGMWQPARSVGGDYFDTLALGNGRAGICIGDVAGKGMPAALLMANLQAAVKATASRDAAPASVCDRVKAIVGGNLAGGKFISFFYGVLDSTSRTFTYSNAGHNPPILVRANNNVERLARGGPAMGRLFKDMPHDQAVVTVGSGDRIVMFTDGASEARHDEEEFGEDRLIELILQSRHLGARELQGRIVDELRTFTGGDFGDDVTLVVISAD